MVTVGLLMTRMVDESNRAAYVCLQRIPKVPLYQPISLSTSWSSSAGRQLIVRWILLSILCVALAWTSIAFDWSGIEIDLGFTHVHVTFYPPIVISKLLVMWFGFTWGIVPACMASLTVALASGMPLAWSFLFAAVDFPGLALVSLAYRSLPFRIDLRAWGAFLFYLFVTLVAYFATSFGAFVWTYTNQIGVYNAHQIWQGWWLGGFLMNTFFTVPLLWMFSGAVTRWKCAAGLTLNWSIPEPRTLAVSLVLVSLAFLVFLGGTHYLINEHIRVAIGNPLASETIEVFKQSFERIAQIHWVQLSASIFFATFGFLIASKWTQSLEKTLVERNRDLHESERRYQTLVEANPDLIFITNAHQRVVFSNPAFNREMGPASHNEPLERFFSHQRWCEIKKEIDRFQVGDREVSDFFQIKILGNSGSDEWYSVRLVKLQYERQPAIQFLAHNINDLKQAERSLRIREQQLFQILDAMPLGVCVVDLSGKIYFFNQAMVQLKPEISQADKLLDVLEQCVLYRPDATNPMKPEEFPTMRALHGGKTISEELTLESKSQSIPIEVWSSPIIGDQGSIQYAVTVVADITLRKKAELQLRKAHQQVQQLTEQLEVENIYLRDEIKNEHDFSHIVGSSEVMLKVLAQVEQVARTGTSVLILGETGTGKELIARAVHELSSRKSRPLVKVNCAALPPQLIESELFGHEKGAFTGAIKQHMGRFELANGGTIFLDEIGEIPLSLQAKLLRVLQERSFERVGGQRLIEVDIRVIAATNRNLKTLVENGSFREDLYYRIDTFPIEIPPLRERKEDIPALLEHFVRKFSAQQGKRVVGVPKSVIKELIRYEWPGNVREFENIIERAMVVTTGSQLKLGSWFSQQNSVDASFQTATLQEVEKRHIRQVLETCGWKVSGANGAAECLGIKPTTLSSRMKKLNISRPDSHDIS